MKKVIAFMIALVLCAGCLSGCFKAQIVPNDTEPTTQTTEPTTEATEPTTQTTEPTTEATEPTTEATEPATEPDGADVTDEDFALSGDWLDLQFVLDGVGYQLNDPYQKLKDNGWYFDMADYGYENGYVLNPGEKVYSTIDLENDSYKQDKYKKPSVKVGIRNNSDTIKDIYECDVWSISVNIDYGFKVVNPHPEMAIGNGLKFGDTAQQVLDACGPCEDVFVSNDNNYQVYEYFVNFDYKLKITVYDEFGITGFELSDYSR